MASYRLSPEAETDLYRIWLYGLEKWDLAQADRYYTAFFERFEELADNPLKYSAVNEIQDGYRRSVCGVDSIYYRIADDGVVEIMAVLGKQNVEEWL